MKLVLCNGGLGNQTFQYIFARNVELYGGEDVILEDSEFFGEHVAHNGYEIPRVFPGAKQVKRLSQCLDSDVWEYMLEQKKAGISIPQQLKNSGEDLMLIGETTDFQFDGNQLVMPANQCIPWITQAKGNIYFHGYWINRDYLKGGPQWEILRKELTFAPFTDPVNMELERKIIETNSASVHIRRGDFVKLGWNTPLSEYAGAIAYTKSIASDAHFFLFSDDIPYCKEHLDELGLSAKEVTYVEGNRGANSYMDMQLMSYCKINIVVGASSFSYLGALLNRNENPIYIHPEGGRAL